MSQGRGHFVCGAIFGIAVGFAVGHLIVRARMSGEGFSTAGKLVPAPSDVFPGAGGLSAPRARLAMRDPHAGGGSIFDRYPAGGGDTPAPARSVITADAFRKDDSASTSSPRQQEPSPLPRVEALPIPPDSRPDDAIETEEEPDELRNLLDNELHSVSPQQKDVWKDALDGVPSGDAAEILRMWKNAGARPVPGGELPRLNSSPSPYYSSSTGPSFSPFLPSPLSASPPPPSEFAIGATRLRASHPKVWRQLQRDLAHAETPGYLRSIPELANADDGPAGPHFRIAAMRTDFVPGKAIPTGSMCDVCLFGNGLFAITTEQGPALTRLGRLGIDSERRLGVRLATSVSPLSPEIRIPAEGEGFEIASDGAVSLIKNGVVATEPLGRIEPVQVLDSSGLAVVETLAGVFVTTPQSGSAHKVPSGAFSLQQFTLEGSNVDAEAIRRWIGRLDALAAEGALLGE